MRPLLARGARCWESRCVCVWRSPAQEVGRGRGMSLLLCNKSWPCLCCCLKITDPSREVSKVPEDTCSARVMVTVSKHSTPCLLAFCQPSFCCLYPSQSAFRPKGYTVYQQNSKWSFKELATSLQQGEYHLISRLASNTCNSVGLVGYFPRFYP